MSAYGTALFHCCYLNGSFPGQLKGSIDAVPSAIPERHGRSLFFLEAAGVVSFFWVFNFFLVGFYKLRVFFFFLVFFFQFLFFFFSFFFLFTCERFAMDPFTSLYSVLSFF